MKQFCQELAPIISNVSKSSSHVIILGDFNTDLLHINERSEFQKYFDLFVTHGFSLKSLPTRCSKSSSSLIDQMFCKLKNPKQHLSSSVIWSCISDHFPCLSIFDILKKTMHALKFVKINRSDDNLRRFTMKLSHISILLKWILICTAIQIEIISALKKFLWMQNLNIVPPKQ